MNKRTNSYGQTGMYVNGTTSADRKIVKVSDDITEKVINLAQSEFLNNFGVTDGEEFNTLRAKYVSAAPEKERLNVAWTLGETFFNESQRIKGIVQELYPNWKEGEPFDRDAVAKLISNGFDKKI